MPVQKLEEKLFLMFHYMGMGCNIVKQLSDVACSLRIYGLNCFIDEVQNFCLVNKLIIWLDFFWSTVCD